jgi:two-component system response regulator MtrA
VVDKDPLLLVEDDPTLLELMRYVLGHSGFRVLTAADADAGWQLFRQEAPAATLIDRNLPGGDGIALCRRLRAVSGAPIMMVTALGLDQDVVEGLEAGADDYLVKPFAPEVLVARVRALVRRATGTPSTVVEVLSCKDLSVDFRSRLSNRSGSEVHLTYTEIALLEALWKAKGAVVTSRKLLASVWGAEYVDDVDILRTHIARLRSKIETNPASPRHVLTIPRQGYRLACIS